MPLIQQFYVSDEQHDAITEAVKALEPDIGQNEAMATLLYTGAAEYLNLELAAKPAPAPAKKPVKRR